jgi:hypothetical protein
MEQAKSPRIYDVPILPQANSPTCHSSTCSEGSPTSGEFVAGLGTAASDSLEDSIFNFDIPCGLFDDIAGAVVPPTLDGAADGEAASEEPREQSLQLWPSIDKTSSWKDFLLDYCRFTIIFP